MRHRTHSPAATVSTSADTRMPSCSDSRRASMCTSAPFSTAITALPSRSGATTSSSVSRYSPGRWMRSITGML